nr:hypothetical protein [Tanacetum cinerariifolium]
VRQFWGFASEVSLPDGARGLVATIDGTAYIVTEASIRSTLQLDDLNATDTMTNEEICAGLRDISRTKFLMYPRFLQIILDTDTEDTTPYPAPLVTKKFLANMRRYQGPDMPLLAHMLNLREPAFEQAQQHDVSHPPPSPVVASHPSPDPMPSPPRQYLPSPIPFGPAPTSGVVSTDPIPNIPSLFRPSEPVLETITSPFRDDDTGGGSFHESPPRPHPATLTVRVAEEPLTLTSLLALFLICLQRIATLEFELKATKILHRDTVVLFAKRIKKLKSKLKTKKRKLVLSDLENKGKHGSLRTMIIYKRLKKQKSLSGLDFTDADIPAGGLDSAGGVDSAGGLTSAGISVATGPTVPAEPSSPLTDPSKGKAVATPSLPVTASTDKELADQQAAILEAKRQELLEQELKQNIDAEQVYLDSLLAQRVAEEHDRESMASEAQSTHRQAKLDRVALNLTNEEWNWLSGLSLTDDQLRLEYDKIRRTVDLANLKRSGETLETSESKKLKSSHSTSQLAELQETTYVFAGATIAAGDPIPTETFSISVASSIPVATPIAAGVSTTAGASGSASEASVPIIELLDSPPKDTSLPLDTKTKEQDEPLSKSSRKKSIARKRTLPSPSKPKSDALPFDEDDPKAAFKRYLRQASDDDEPVEPASLALVSDITTWELILTEFGHGEIHVITRAVGIVKRFSTLRELMYWAGKADLMVLYGLVSDKYKTERATGIGLGLWMDLRNLITAREERDASIIWDDQDQWQIWS